MVSPKDRDLITRINLYNLPTKQKVALVQDITDEETLEIFATSTRMPSQIREAAKTTLTRLRAQRPRNGEKTESAP